MTTIEQSLFDYLMTLPNAKMEVTFPNEGIDGCPISFIFAVKDIETDENFLYYLSGNIDDTNSIWFNSNDLDPLSIEEATNLCKTVLESVILNT